MNRKLPVVADGNWDKTRAKNPSQQPAVAGSPFSDMLARGLAQDALQLAQEAYEEISAGKLRAKWGKVTGDIEDQTDLQEEFAISEHALCGGL